MIVPGSTVVHGYQTVIVRASSTAGGAISSSSLPILIIIGGSIKPATDGVIANAIRFVTCKSDPISNDV
uniref:Uncharacterized protein n=1 Tax=Acrobeloides nanus TaxID=290746 RepID=A0A914DG33_9BILA